MVVRRRVIAELLRMGSLVTTDGQNAVLDPDPNREDFSHRISSHREAVSRVFAQLDRAGVIENVKPNSLKIDMEKLRILLTGDS